MGASDFWTKASGKTAKEAFSAARTEAQYESGHGGYTGTIAEKHSFIVLEPTAGTTPEAFARALAEGADDRYEDKWGPALCVKLGEGKWLFFGVASC